MVTCKVVALLTLLYLFICSLGFLSSAFRLLGGKTAGSVFSESELLQNPVTGLMIGILATVLVQSSSTSSSIVVTMVASGILEVKPAIPIIMGANIGTSVTNTIVSMAQSADRETFKLAFAGATVHDMFNWLSVAVLLPLEVATGYLEKLTSWIVSQCDLSSISGGNQQLLKVITKPFTSRVIKINKKLIEKIAAGKAVDENESILKVYCDYNETTITSNGTDGNATETVQRVPIEKCGALFSQLDLGDTATGLILLFVSLALLCLCLIFTVKLLNSMMHGSIAKAIKKTVNAEFPGPCRHLTGFVTIIVGAILTVLVQSSSIFTSTLTPLVGLGLIEIERMYPLTLGSNIGTTMTGLLAACAASSDKAEVAFQIAFCHLFFNVSGIILYYPVPCLRNLPIRGAKCLGETTAKYRWFAILYLILMFVLLPVSVFTLSLAGKTTFICVSSLVGIIVLFIIGLNIMQRKCQKVLPKCFHTWEFLPEFMRSLAPLDNVIRSLLSVFTGKCPCGDKEPKLVKGSPDSSVASSTASSTRELLNTGSDQCKVDLSKISQEEASQSLLPTKMDFHFSKIPGETIL
ncbi:sodium-dependent phosphate transport protein 2A-like isoform X2 [Argopecten irradians]